MDYVDSHLQSAIRADERKYVFRYESTKCPVYLRPYLFTLPIPREQINIQSENQYGQILKEVYNSEATILKWVQYYLPSAFEVSFKVIKETLEEIIPHLRLSEIKSDPYISRLISICVVWEDIRAQMQSLVVKECRWIPVDKHIGVIKKYYLSGKFMLNFINNSWYAFSYDQVMMISDTIWARCNVLMYHYLLSTGLTSKVPPVYIEKCYSIIDKEFVKYGNNIYDAIKSWEPIILGALVEDYDPYDGGTEYISPVLRDMDDAKYYFIRDLYNYIKSLKLLPDQYSELHGLYRHWGHPSVDEIAACYKTREISQHRPVPKMRTLIDSIGCLKRQFIVSFIQKHGRWPTILNHNKITNKTLWNMVQTHARHLNLYQPTIKLEDWYNLDLGKEMEFDYHLDYTELLDDKAISPFRNELRTLFNPTVIGYNPGKPKRSRRLLRTVLEVTELDIKAIITLIRRREVPWEWFIVILHSKERELKLKPRLFAMMVLEMRMYFCVTEKNIAENIFPYFPQQTMTLSEAELSKRIYKFTDINTPTSYIPFYVMIDFKSWNIHWSELSTHDAFQLLDDLQGVPGLYTFTHEFFSQCLMVLSSSLLPPSSIIGDQNRSGDPEECETLWYNHLGGWDGLRQKGWTIATIAILLLVEHKTGIQSQIVGQADNQICKILIPRRSDGSTNDEYIKANMSEIKKMIMLFTETLDTLVTDIGLVLKKEESLVSSVLTIYGKEMTLNGAHLSQASKKISRALSEINIAVPSLFSKTLTLHSSGLSTAQKTHTPVIPCLIANVLSLINFINGARFSVLTGKKNPPALWDWIDGENAMMFLLLGSSDAGGMPVQNILDYLYRGHPDSLTSYTTYLHILAKNIPIARKLYLYLQTRKYTVGKADPELLVSNPCSTNITSFPLVSSRYRKKLEILIQQKTRNKDLRSLFPSTSQEEDKAVFEFLLKFRPIQPRLLHEIFRLTPTCSRLTFLAKFTSTRTVHSMLREESRKVIMDDTIDFDSYLPQFSEIDIVVDDIDTGMLTHLKNMYSAIRAINDDKLQLLCPTQLAKDMRQFSWKDLIGDNKLDGVTIPHPVHQFNFNFPYLDDHDGCVTSKEFCIFIPLTKNPKSILSERGPHPPYIGSKTREKITGKIYTIPTTARPFKAAERAIILSDWCVNPNSDLAIFLSSIVKSRTDIAEVDLKRVVGRIAGGTSIHRLDSHMGSTSTLNNLLANSTTHILFSTDTMGRFSQGRENYVMHFQGVIHTGISLLTIFIAHQNLVPLIAHLHYSGSCCEELIDDSLVSGFAEPPVLPYYPDNPLLFSSMGAIGRDKFESMKGITICNHTDSSWALSFILLSRIRTRVLSSQWGVTETTAPVVSSLGVQEILRIGVKQIVKSLAKIMYLHIDYEDRGMELLLQSISHDIWGDLSNIILMPDVLRPTIKYLDIDGVPDAFSNPKNISRQLNRILIEEVITYHNHPNRIKSILPFHIYGNIKLPHILRMWGKLIYIRSHKELDMRPIIRDVLVECREIADTSTSLSASISSKIVVELLRRHGMKGFTLAWKQYPLKICYKPPETLLRIHPFLKVETIEKLKPFSVSDVKYERYALSLLVPPRSDVIDHVNLNYNPGTLKHKQKLRADHMYRTIGQVSTAYLKYMEIIFKEGINLGGTAICTADGEASVGFLLYKLTRKPIIYNSLVDIPKLPPQRGYNYIPGSFLVCPEGLLNSHANTLLGGNITHHSVRESIIKCVHKNNLSICLITCDAESSFEFSLNNTVSIILSICYIGFSVKANASIIKTYILDGETMSYIGGHLQTIWREVKLVTPCFSSYESTECFWVCKDFNPIIDDYGMWFDWDIGGNIPVPLSCTQLIPHMLDYLRERRSFKLPIQSQYPDTTKLLISYAKKLGFRSNLVQSYYTVTNNLLHFDKDIPLRKNLELGHYKIRTFMYDYLRGMQQVYEGKAIDVGLGAVVSKGRVVHTTIESFIIAYRNIILTLKLSTFKDKIGEADQFIHQSSVTETPIHDFRGNIVYKYKDVDEHEWRQRYLKSIWKLVGFLD